MNSIEDDDSIESDNKGEIQLGFIKVPQKQFNDIGLSPTLPPSEEQNFPLFTSSDWTTWDGGKVGGKPTWLDNIRVPNVGTLNCYCGTLMKFILQIYCPLDDNIDAFHRAIYLFCCPNKKCIDSYSIHYPSILALRCQLPRENSIYPFDPLDREHTSNSKRESLKFCEICSLKASYSCSKCKSVHFCSKEHQIEFWPIHKKRCLELSSEKSLPSSSLDGSYDIYYPEYELIIEIEDFTIENDDKNESDFISSSQTNIWDDAIMNSSSMDKSNELDSQEEEEKEEEDEEDTPEGENYVRDEDLNQNHYNSALGNEIPDRTYKKFLKRIELGGADQVLRFRIYFNLNFLIL